MKKFLKMVMVAGIAAAVAHLVSLHKKRKKKFSWAMIF